MCPLYSMTPILNHKDTTCPHMTSPFQLGSVCLAKYSGAKCTLKWLVLRRLSSCRNPPKTDNETWCSSCPLLAPTFFSSCFLLAPVLCWLQLRALSAFALISFHPCQLLPLVSSCPCWLPSLSAPASCWLLLLVVSIILPAPSLVGFHPCRLLPLLASALVSSHLCAPVNLSSLCSTMGNGH